MAAVVVLVSTSLCLESDMTCNGNRYEQIIEIEHVLNMNRMLQLLMAEIALERRRRCSHVVGATAQGGTARWCCKTENRRTPKERNERRQRSKSKQSTAIENSTYRKSCWFECTCRQRHKRELYGVRRWRLVVGGAAARVAGSLEEEEET
ncbi:hypothetical protein A2U01_0036704, partial [Trifolium medium]|nr:hypothetical protein [Trifolium medium]